LNRHQKHFLLHLFRLDAPPEFAPFLHHLRSSFSPFSALWRLTFATHRYHQHSGDSQSRAPPVNSESSSRSAPRSRRETTLLRRSRESWACWRGFLAWYRLVHRAIAYWERSYLASHNLPSVLMSFPGRGAWFCWDSLRGPRYPLPPAFIPHRAPRFSTTPPDPTPPTPPPPSQGRKPRPQKKETKREDSPPPRPSRPCGIIIPAPR